MIKRKKTTKEKVIATALKNLNWKLAKVETKKMNKLLKIF